MIRDVINLCSTSATFCKAILFCLVPVPLSSQITFFVIRFDLQEQTLIIYLTLQEYYQFNRIKDDLKSYCKMSIIR